MTLENKIEVLAETLTENISLYNSMIEELGIEKKALEAHALPKIESAFKRKSLIAEKIGKLETRRLSAIYSVAESMGRPSTGLTLTQIAKFAGDVLQERILELGKLLKTVVKRVTEFNEFNKQLILNLIKINTGAAEVVKEILAPVNTYQKHGFNSAPIKPSGVLDRKM